MPVATLPPPKRVLADSTNAHRNIKPQIQSPNAAKRRKIQVASSPSKKLKLSQNSLQHGSSQPKSQFEEEYLEKLTQDISGLKQQNSEKDQQWDRPSLDDFDENKDSLCFQQIEAEEGTLHGGKTTVKLFGVTEVALLPCLPKVLLKLNHGRPVTLYSFMSPISSITSMSELQSVSSSQTSMASRPTWKLNWRSTSRPSIRSR